MPRVRIKPPAVDVDVPPEVLDVVDRAADVGRRARSSGIVDAVKGLWGSIRDASKRPPPRR